MTLPLRYGPIPQARATYDDATRSGGWWDAFSDRVACAWDDAKCRVKETMGMGAVGGGMSHRAGCVYPVGGHERGGWGCAGRGA